MSRSSKSANSEKLHSEDLDDSETENESEEGAPPEDSENNQVESELNDLNLQSTGDCIRANIEYNQFIRLAADIYGLEVTTFSPLGMLHSIGYLFECENENFKAIIGLYSFVTNISVECLL